MLPLIEMPSKKKNSTFVLSENYKGWEKGRATRSSVCLLVNKRKRKKIYTVKGFRAYLALLSHKKLSGEISNMVSFTKLTTFGFLSEYLSFFSWFRFECTPAFLFLLREHFYFVKFIYKLTCMLSEAVKRALGVMDDFFSQLLTSSDAPFRAENSKPQRVRSLEISA